MDDEGAIEGLARLGLTTYEARVFVALQKLGSGTASDVADVSEVPRSQVYGAAEGLEERGLVETRQSTPTVYRPADPEVARQRLLDQLAETGAQTFEYLEGVQGSVGDGERSEDIWLVHGADAVASRAADLAREADGRVVYGVDDAGMLEAAVLDALRACAERGVRAVVASADGAVREAVEPPVETHPVPDDQNPELRAGRVLLVDDDTILLSVFSTATGGEGVEEVAFWSEGSTFAAVLVEFAGGWLAAPTGADGPD
jgi:sugar-specific transcriptional regulator TrmB